MIVHLWTITVCNSPNRHSDFMCETYNIYPNIICALDCLYMVYACFGKKKCMNFFFFFFFLHYLMMQLAARATDPFS